MIREKTGCYTDKRVEDLIRSERMSDYVWHLVRDSDVHVHKQETRNKKAVRFVEKSDFSSEK